MNKILVKNDSVKFKEFNNFHIEIFDFFIIMAEICNESMIVTSANDGNHKKGSQHYKNLALDFRGRHLILSYAIEIIDHFELHYPINRGEYLLQFEYWISDKKKMVKTNYSKPDWQDVMAEYYDDPTGKVCHFHVEQRA